MSSMLESFQYKQKTEKVRYFKTFAQKMVVKKHGSDIMVLTNTTSASANVALILMIIL